jgi:hypothetical protein
MIHTKEDVNTPMNIWKFPLKTLEKYGQSKQKNN